MKDTADLERGYRRVLAFYPKAFRKESAEEILAVLLDTAVQDQRRVGLAECAALVRGGLRMRLRPASRPPRSVRSAVRLMCAGAVAELAAVITMVVTTASVKVALAKDPGLTAAQWHTVTSLLTFKEVSGAIAVGLWLFLAWAISQRRDVARLAFAGFFALTTLSMLIALAQHGAVYAPADVIAGATVWVITLATVVLLFTRQSNAFYRQAGHPAAAQPAR